MPDHAVVDITSRLPQPRVALVDLLDRVLAGGAVLAGDVTLCVADVPLVRISLRALVVSMRADRCSSTQTFASPGTSRDERLEVVP
jgi:hypothetical protein